MILAVGVILMMYLTVVVTEDAEDAATNKTQPPRCGVDPCGIEKPHKIIRLAMVLKLSSHAII